MGTWGLEVVKTPILNLLTFKLGHRATISTSASGILSSCSLGILLLLTSSVSLEFATYQLMGYFTGQQ
jgi:hypothetical protein